MFPFPIAGRVSYVCVNVDPEHRLLCEDTLLFNIAEKFPSLRFEITANDTLRRTPFGEAVKALHEMMNRNAVKGMGDFEQFFFNNSQVLLPVLAPMREQVTFRHFTVSPVTKTLIKRIEVGMFPPARYPAGMKEIGETLGVMHPKTPIVCNYGEGKTSALIYGSAGVNAVGPFHRIQQLCKCFPG